MSCHLSDCALRKRPRKGVGLLCCESEAHVGNFNLTFLGVVAVQLCLMHSLTYVVVHKLNKLVGHVFLVVLNALKI